MAAGNLRVRVSTTNVKPEYRDGVVLMAFHRDVPKTQQSLIISSVGAREIKQIGVGVHVLEVGRGSVLKTIQALKAHPGVRYAEPDYLQTLAASSAPNDTSFGLQWALQNTGQNVNGVTGTSGADERAMAAWGVTTGTNSVVVVILDTGVQYSHPDLQVNMWNNPGGIGGCPAGTHGYNVVSSNCDPMDLDTAYGGHGSHIAGIIGAVTNNAAGVAGVNWTASIMALKWLTSNSSGNTSDLITAMDWVVQAKQAGVNVRVANDSVTFVGTAFSQALSDEIDLFGTNDILFVTAAGNTAQNNDTVARYPCSYHRPNMICVAATDQNDHLWSSSNFGPTTVDLAAPGVNIYSTLRLSNYGYISGTSMSAGEVSGTAALVLSRGNQTTSNLKSDILNNVDTLPALNGFVSTSGRLDVCKAVPGCSSAVTGSPTNSSLPVVTAIAQFGSLLGASTGMWSGVPTNYTYQWFRCDGNGSNCVSIVGANSQTYALLADADVGATLRVTVTASNGSGSSSAQSAASAVVTQASSPFGINSSILDGGAIGGSLPWQASPTPSVNFVQFFIDGVLSQTYSSSPYTYNRGTTNALDTTTLSNGTHVLGIRALSTDNITYGFYGATVVVSNSFAITTASLPNGTQNTAYSATLAASGGTTPYTWSISSGSLPAGLTLNSSTGAITGTPTGTGTSNFTVQVSDANSQTATKALSITISSGGGGGGVISVLQARNANQSGVTSLTVNMATTAGSTIICGVSEGDNATDTWTMTDSAGQLGWTQDASGYLTADTTQRADMRYITNSAALSFVRANFSTRINAPATMVCYEVSGIVSVSAEDSSVNTTSRGGGLVSGPLTTSNANDILIYMERKGANQTSWTAGSGYVFAANAFNARMAIQYKIVSASQTNTMTSMTPNPDSGSSSIGIFAAFKSSGSPPSPTITTASLTNGTQNTAYSATLAASGGTTPYTWSITAGSLPAGLTLNSSTGAISGTPTGTGTSNFTVQVSDANSQTATKALSITVNPPALAISTTSLPNGTQNTAYSATLAASGGTTPYTWSISAGSLPAGLTLNSSTGAITGTPTGSGVSNFTVKVTDVNSQTATQALSITINSAGGGISVLQAQNANLTGVSSITVNIATQAGSAIICGVREGDNSTDTWTMTDSAGQTGWSQVASGYVSPNTTNRADMRYITNSVALTWVRANFSSPVSNPATMVCYEVSGIVTVSAQDASINSTSSGGGLVSRPLTTSNANDILIYMEGKGANQTSWAAGPGYLFPANAANPRVAIQYKIVSTTQTNTTTSMTPSPDTGSSASVFAAFK
ncbi:MAG TPA: putative Ig domain-containing protein [Terriglobia bacterium]|nr:putative Ig domain-containing protein [Terriglobia bacterium]